MIESSIMSLKTKPKFFTADNGYYTDQALEYYFNHNINLIIPDRTEAERKNNNRKNKYHKSKFIENRQEKQFYMSRRNKIAI